MVGEVALSRRFALTVLCGVLLAGHGLAAPERGIVVGSKNFTESVVLGDLIRTMAVSTGASAEHHRALELR